MRIGIDTRGLSRFDNKAGLYQYVYNLVANLLSIDSSNDYALLSTLRGFRGDGNIDKRHLYRFSGRLSDLMLERLSIPVEFLMGKIDIFHGPSFFIPNHIRSKSVVTIHDLMMLRHPEFLTQDMANAFKKKIYSAIRKFDTIISVSNFTKSEIIDLLNIPERRIRVIYNGIDSKFRPINDKTQLNSIKAKYGINGKGYLLFVGNIETKKNIDRLVHAYALLRKETDCQHSLVIAGNRAWHFETVRETVRKFSIEEDVLFLGVVHDEDLPCLYSGAEVFVFPSLYEGFGIPVIEAMACGTPVISSNNSSVPEIAGGAAILVNPTSVSEISEAMYNVLSDSRLRQQLVEKGFRRAKDFSWEKTARETLKLYHEL